MFIPYFPKYPLREYINMLWYHNATISYQRERILPTGTIEVIINLGSPSKVFRKNDIRLYKDYWVCGMFMESILHEPVAETHMIGISFKPFGAYSFLNIPLFELKNKQVDLDLIWGNEASELKELLLEQKSPQDRLRVAESFLATKMINKQNHFIEIIKWLDFQLAQPRNDLLENLYWRIGYSKKHIIQEFRKFTGLTPKDLKQVYRFNTALKAVDPNHINWTELALECEYYDQAHFNNQFKNFTAMTPSEYIRSRNQFLNSPVKGEDIHFVPVS